MKDDNGAPVDLNSLANRSGRHQQQRTASISRVARGGPIQPGPGRGRSSRTARRRDRRRSNSAGTGDEGRASRRRPIPGVAMSVPVSTPRPSSGVRSIPGAKRCYQKGLESDPYAGGQARHPDQGRAERRSRLRQRRPATAGYRPRSRAASRRWPSGEVRSAGRKRLDHQRAIQLREAGRRLNRLNDAPRSRIRTKRASEPRRSQKTETRSALKRLPGKGCPNDRTR